MPCQIKVPIILMIFMLSSILIENVNLPLSVLRHEINIVPFFTFNKMLFLEGTNTTYNFFSYVYSPAVALFD